MQVLRRNKKMLKPAILNFLRRKKEELKKRLAEIDEKLNQFRSKYGDIEQFSTKLPDDFQSHEIWFEWKSLIELRDAINKELVEIDRAIKEVVEEI